jgi:hypothetical protein
MSTLDWLAQRRKGLAAAITAGLVAAQYALPLSDAAHGWVTVGIAVLGAGTTYAVPNAPLTKAKP